MVLDPLTTFNVSIPEELKYFVESIDTGENIQEEGRILLVIELSAGKRVTLARTAQLTGKSIHVFIDMLRAHDLSWIDYTEDEWEEDERTINDLYKNDEHQA